MSEERKAVYYGKVELIPGIICDGYVLDDGTAVMSERGTADLLGVDHMLLNRMKANLFPEAIKPFMNGNFSMETNVPTELSESLVDQDSGMETNSPLKMSNPFISNHFIMETNSVEVVAENSPYQGRKIVVYTAKIVETLISSYALALASRTLRKSQRHIGERCVMLAVSLIRTALDAAIREACGLPIHIQQTAQQHYLDAVKLVCEAGLVCSVEKDKIATKRDICQFLGIPLGTLNSFLRKYKDDIIPIQLDRQTMRALGFKPAKMNAYSVEDVARIALSMNTVPGIEIKGKLFGPIGIFAKPDTSKEVQWQAKLGVAFNGFGFHHNYPVGPYRVDFLIGSSKVVLECNGYEHHYYDDQREREREAFITRDYGLVRFDHQIDLEKLINAILRVKPGEVIRLFEPKERHALV